MTPFQRWMPVISIAMISTLLTGSAAAQVQKTFGRIQGEVFDTAVTSCSSSPPARALMKPAAEQSERV